MEYLWIIFLPLFAMVRYKGLGLGLGLGLGAGSGEPLKVGSILLETGDVLLLETDDKYLLEG